MRTIKFAKGPSGRPAGSYTLADGRTRGVQLREPASNDFLVPVDDLAATVGAGGALAADTYFYVVTATDAVGESTASNEDSATTETTNLTINLAWTAVTGATGYNVYRSLTSGSGYELLDTSLTNSYADTGSETPAAGTPPTVNASGKRAAIHYEVSNPFGGAGDDDTDVRGTGTWQPGTWHL